MSLLAIILFVNICVLFLILDNALLWPRIKYKALGQCSPPCVSLLIPARNEEHNIQDAILSAVHQPSILEILVYNDHSTDSTAEIVQNLARRFPHIRLINPVRLPHGWCGKPFACWQLAQQAQGEWLLFLDADARLQSHSVEALVATATRFRATFLSAWPGLEIKSLAEAFFMPLLNFVVFSLFPAPLSLKMMIPSLGLAHGACILAHRQSYLEVGGHSLVRGEIFEDTALARAWRQRGHTSICLDGQEIVRVRMYDSLKAIWRGFEKVAYPAFRSKLNFWLFLGLHVATFVAPFLVGVAAARGGVWLWEAWASVGTAVLARLVQCVQFRYPCWSALLHPLAEIGLIALLLSSAAKCFFGIGVTWKGRRYHTDRCGRSS